MGLKHLNGDITTSRSLIGADNLSNSDQADAVKDFNRFQILNNKVLKILRPLILEYSTSNIDELAKLETYNNEIMIEIDRESNFYNDKISRISSFNYDINLFSNYQQTFKAVLTGLQSAIGDLRTNLELNNINAQLVISDNILNGSNKDLISKYIIQKNTEGLPFDANQILDIDLDIKPWYSEYLIKYGAPSNGIFDTEKLSFIVAELIDNGVITIDEFISDRLN